MGGERGCTHQPNFIVPSLLQSYRFGQICTDFSAPEGGVGRRARSWAGYIAKGFFYCSPIFRLCFAIKCYAMLCFVLGTCLKSPSAGMSYSDLPLPHPHQKIVKNGYCHQLPRYSVGGEEFSNLCHVFDNLKTTQKPNTYGCGKIYLDAERYIVSRGKFYNVYNCVILQSFADSSAIVPKTPLPVANGLVVVRVVVIVRNQRSVPPCSQILLQAPVRFRVDITCCGDLSANQEAFVKKSCLTFTAKQAQRHG